MGVLQGDGNQDQKRKRFCLQQKFLQLSSLTRKVKESMYKVNETGGKDKEEA